MSKTCSNKCKIDSTKCLEILSVGLIKWVWYFDILGKRIDDIEKSIGEIMHDLGEEEEAAGGKK